MLKWIALSLALPSAVVAAYFAAAYSSEKGFRDSLLDYIYNNSSTEDIEIKVIEPEDSLYRNDPLDFFSYRNGDWRDNIIAHIYKDLGTDKNRTSIYEGDEIKIQTYGSLGLDLLYGKSSYTKKKFQSLSKEKASSQVIKEGFRPEQNIQIHMEGKVGDRVTAYIDHDSQKEDNYYWMQYKALRDDEIIREINAGEIKINFNESKYAVYDNYSARGLGLDLTLQKNKFRFKAFGCVTKGNIEVENFKGNSSPVNIRISEYQYIKRTYYQIEPLIRYSNILTPPYPPGYALRPVNVNPYSLEVWIDDQNPNNNINSIRLSIDGGYYNKLQSGVDYKCNFSTGLIQFLKDVSPQSRVFAVYNLFSGVSSDPFALLPGSPQHPGGLWQGKIFAFIKYGFSMTGAPGTLPGQNRDIYEIRSFYSLGDRNIMPDSLIIQFYREGGIMTGTDIASLGRYTIDYSNGIIQFLYREPYRELLVANNTVGQIYIETQPPNVYEYSRFRIKSEYYKESRSFQLKHSNIILDSVHVKINGREIEASLFTVDYVAGYLNFTNPYNPLIGRDTQIEIRYEYMPIGSQTREFIGGFRSEYKFNKNFKLGGSLMYSRSTGTDKVPDIGSEPTQNIFVEGDASLYLDGKSFASVSNFFTSKKKQSLPVEMKGYAEYSRNFRNINTFGKAMVENMESSEDVVNCSLLERDWLLSSRRAGATARSKLNYVYMAGGAVGGLGSIPVPVDYSVKAGPYNMKIGHLLENFQDQTSMVMDCDENGDFASIVTRRFSKEGAADLSAVQYVEVSYRYEGNGNADLFIDIGQVHEDSDGDGILDSEDLNFNGYLDSDPSTGFSEDIGYQFNEAGHPITRVGNGANISHLTRGDGVLTTEDLNGNNVLDQVENVFSFNGQSVQLDSANGNWITKRLYIDQSILTMGEKDLLRRVEAVRLTVRKANGVRSRVFIDGIKFVSSKWRDIRMDGSLASTDNVKVAMINSTDDNEYRLESFMFIMNDAYRALYGPQKPNEIIKLKETALRIDYNTPPTAKYISVSKRLQNPIDIRHYKTLSIWLNFRNFNPGDKVSFVIGSSENDFVEYLVNMDFPHIWSEYKLRLINGSGGFILPGNMSGILDLKRVNYLSVRIYPGGGSSSGSLWVNDIYLSDPEIVADSAQWFEGEVKITKPLYETIKGTPVFSDVNIKYVHKGHGKNFSTIGKQSQDMSENSKQVFSSVNILPNWKTTVDFMQEDSLTDGKNEMVPGSKRGNTRLNYTVVVSDYQSNKNAIPSVKLIYKYENYNNRINERSDNGFVIQQSKKDQHLATVLLRENVDKFLWGKWYAECSLGLFFKRDQIIKNPVSSTIDYNFSNMPYELEKRQRADLNLKLDYSNKLFYLRPSLIAGSEEIVSLMGKNNVNNAEISGIVYGDYHLPFTYKTNCKLVDRGKNFSAAAGLNDSYYVAPGYKIEIQYMENRFRNYDLSEPQLYQFKRSKDARTYVATTVDIPVAFNKIKRLKSISNFNIVYKRTLMMSQLNVPFEGEKKGEFNEKYGINYGVNSIAGGGLNIFKFYPFYFFFGRNNYGNGRDYLLRTMNNKLIYSHGEIVNEYDSSLRLIDYFTVNMSADFKIFNLDFNAILNQACDRQNSWGLPNQIISSGVQLNMNVDLMKVFKFSFFRANTPELPYHSAFFNLGFKYDNNLMITSNINEKVYSPSLGTTFKRDRASIGVKFGVDIRRKNTEAFISFNPIKRSAKDQVYYTNIAQYQYFRERNLGYNLSAMYETDVQWLFRIFSLMYRLVSAPIFSFEYAMNLNRYKYLVSAMPDPYDLHLFTMKLGLDLHKNIQGGLSSRFALEQYRSKINLNNYKQRMCREIYSYELGLHLKILF
jgi:hypothetical protein